MQRLIGLLIITVIIIMLALAGNTIFRNAPLDGTWSVFLGGIIATIFGVPEVAARLKENKEKREQADLPAPQMPSPATPEGGVTDGSS